MKLIVGLGNPGSNYENTRHNMGFMSIDKFAYKNNIDISKNKFNGLYGEFVFNGEKIILLKPQSYINLSGEVVKKYVDYFKINIDDVLIIHDDLDIRLGNIKIKATGSSGGHNGLKNIELHLGTKDYKRVKLGISNNKIIDTKDYVLGHIIGDSKRITDEVIDISTFIIADYLSMPFDKLMNKYNKKN